MVDIHVQRLRFLLQATDQISGGSEVGDATLGELGLNRAQVADDVLVPSEKAELLFVRYACEKLGDNSFAAHAGLAFNDYTTLTAYISKYSRNLHEAIENSAKYYTYMDPAFELGLRVTSNIASFELRIKDPGLSRFHRFIEFVMFSGLGRMRTVTGVDFFPTQIRFMHQGRDVATRIERLAGFPVVFGAEKNEMLLSRSTLELPIPTYDPSLRDHLKQYGNTLRPEKPVERMDLRSRVEGLLAASLPGHIVPAEDMAANLGMSRRTFARRLSDESLSYREIVDDMRCDLACTYLKDGFNIAEISFYLDYADQAAFSTAFKRWTGDSPSAYRSRFLQN
ncbi:AraC family transcriptional regulator [uncultured Shimia sp.]|uniref:helix-turn-helix domain-containing protein n=1 Tax=uncultured Shimia sp. TaxID=573152 RepID=UPI002618061C|nr:AraC family transcriptional regulator [uncultured Shimia sp.]